MDLTVSRMNISIIRMRFRSSLFPTTILLVLLFSCNQKGETDTGSKNETENNVDEDSLDKHYYKGNLQAEFSVEDSLKQGLGKIYYEDGKLSSECNYINGLKNGIEKKYYLDGTLYRTREYSEGKINGLEKRYYRNGKLKTLQTYKQDMPGRGLIEYHQNGSIITKFPEFKYEIIYDRDYKRQKLLIFYFAGIDKNVRFYEGQLVEGKFFDAKVSPCGICDGKGEIGFNDSDFHGTITISAKCITSNRSPYVLEKKITI